MPGGSTTLGAPARPFFQTALACWLALLACAATPALAQSNVSTAALSASQAAPGTNDVEAGRALFQRSEEARTVCMNGRRRVCGLVLQILPEGLIVDSGYTSLLRPELSTSWVVPGTVQAARTPNLVEQTSPGSICVGMVLLANPPRRQPVKQYDYVVVEAYPAGSFDYAPVPNVKKTLRAFSVGLDTAIQRTLASSAKP